MPEGEVQFVDDTGDREVGALQPGVHTVRERAGGSSGSDVATVRGADGDQPTARLSPGAVHDPGDAEHVVHLPYPRGSTHVPPDQITLQGLEVVDATDRVVGFETQLATEVVSRRVERQSHAEVQSARLVRHPLDSRADVAHPVL
ncbi:MAG: hypothetical protein DSY88_11165, partial [Candidatus Poseidoniales archaeon]